LDQTLIGIAMAGFAAGAGLSFFVSAHAPRAMRWVKLGAIIGVVVLPFLVSLSGAQPLIQLARGSDTALSFSIAMWVTFLVLSAPFGAFTVALFKQTGPRLAALTAGGLVGLPLYLTLSVALMAMRMATGRLEDIGSFRA
jgi:hypothetical protein